VNVRLLKLHTVQQKKRIDLSVNVKLQLRMKQDVVDLKKKGDGGRKKMTDGIGRIWND
jgi:hypothetical protein